MTISPNSATVKVGERLKLSSASGVKWTSSNPAIAAVGASGEVTGKAAGTATITARKGNKTARATVTVIAVVPEPMPEPTPEPVPEPEPEPLPEPEPEPTPEPTPEPPPEPEPTPEPVPEPVPEPTPEPIPTPPPSGGAAHDHYNALIALPHLFAAHDLRSQADLDSITDDGLPSTGYTYGNDPWPNPQDAALLHIPDSKVHLHQQLRVPVHQTSGTFLFTWDHWYGSEWRIQQMIKEGVLRQFCSEGGIVGANYSAKEFQVAMAAGGTGPGKITFEIRTRYSRGSGFHASTSCADVGTVDIRTYMGATAVAGMIAPVPYNPTGPGAEPFEPGWPIRHSTWTRYVVMARLNQDASAFTDWKAHTGKDLAPGLYHEFSVWVGDAARGFARIVYKVPMSRVYPASGEIRDGISTFWFEHNTSSTLSDFNGDRHQYARNFVCLKDRPLPARPEDDATIFSLVGL